MDDSSEQLRLLVQRRDLLAHITEGITDRRELASLSSNSQSTVYRALKELSEADLLSERHGHYELTALGEQLLGHVQGLYAEARTLNDVDRLRGAPSLDVLQPCVFEGASVTTTERHAPNKPLDPVCRLLESSERIVAFTPVLFPELASELETRAPDTALELLVEADWLRSRDDSTSNQSETVEVVSPDYAGIVEDQLPFGLFVSTTPEIELCVVILDGGLPSATLHNETETAGRWALDRYSRYRQTSQALAKWRSRSTVVSDPA